MTTLTAEVTKEIKQLAQDILRTGMYKSQSEVVRDAIRQLAVKYQIKGGRKDAIRKKIAAASKKSGRTLSETIVKIRDQE